MVLWQGIDYALISVAIHFTGLLESYIQTGRNVDSRASEINLQNVLHGTEKLSYSQSISLVREWNWKNYTRWYATRINKTDRKEKRKTLRWHSWGLQNPPL